MGEYKSLSTVITGTGCYVPSKKVLNEYFLRSEFYDSKNAAGTKPNQEVISEFVKITGILERRYADVNEVASDLAYKASVNCLNSWGGDPDDLNYIIFAHNFGDITLSNRRTSIVPNLALRLKSRLKIENRKTEAFDLPFGCPGWVQGIIHAHKFFNGGFGNKALVVGAETLSRVTDFHDRDGMIYSDGAGAAIVEAKQTYVKTGILSHSVDCGNSSCTEVMGMGPSNKIDPSDGNLYFKMYPGHKVFVYAKNNVPRVIKESIDQAGLELKDISKLLLHQANEKMDREIVENLFGLYGVEPTDDQIKKIMPMIISHLGNSSVATVPTLLDKMLKCELENQFINPGDKVVFASVGAGGPNINSIVYEFPPKFLV